MSGPALFSHVSICVSDPARSAKFYTEALGFTSDKILEIGAPFDVLTELPGMTASAHFMVQGDTRIELLSFTNPGVVGSGERRAMNQLGVTHLSFVVASIAATGALIEAHGGQMLHQTRVTSPMGDMIFCTDPDGLRLELWERTA